MREWSTLQEAAAATGVPAVTLRRWAAEGRVVAEKRGKIWLVQLGSITPRPSASRFQLALRGEEDLLAEVEQVAGVLGIPPASVMKTALRLWLQRHRDLAQELTRALAEDQSPSPS